MSEMYDDDWRKEMRSLTKAELIEVYRIDVLMMHERMRNLQNELTEWKSKLSDYSKKPRIKNL